MLQRSPEEGRLNCPASPFLCMDGAPERPRLLAVALPPLSLHERSALPEASLAARRSIHLLA